MPEHGEGAAEGLKNGNAGHPPEHSGERSDVVGGEEGCPRRGEIGGEIAVAGDEKNRGGVEERQRNHPLHVSKAEGRDFTRTIEIGKEVETLYIRR